MLLDNEIELELATVRASRNLLLKQCDWTQLADVPLSDAKKLEFAEYRQQLRDITEPFKSVMRMFSQGVTQALPPITWPVRPEL